MSTPRLKEKSPAGDDEGVVEEPLGAGENHGIEIAFLKILRLCVLTGIYEKLPSVSKIISENQVWKY